MAIFLTHEIEKEEGATLQHPRSQTIGGHGLRGVRWARLELLLGPPEVRHGALQPLVLRREAADTLLGLLQCRRLPLPARAGQRTCDDDCDVVCADTFYICIVFTQQWDLTLVGFL